MVSTEEIWIGLFDRRSNLETFELKFRGIPSGYREKENLK